MTQWISMITELLLLTVFQNEFHNPQVRIKKNEFHELKATFKNNHIPNEIQI